MQQQRFNAFAPPAGQQGKGPQFFAAGAPAASSSLVADAAILGGEAGASLLTQGAAGAGGKGAGAASGLTGAAAALGPYGIPILIGAGLLAASS